jgi:hypothetical protein
VLILSSLKVQRRSGQNRGATRPQSVAYTTATMHVCDQTTAVRPASGAEKSSRMSGRESLPHHDCYEREKEYRSVIQKWNEYDARVRDTEKALRAEVKNLTAQRDEARKSVEALQKPMLMARDRFQPCEDGQLKGLLEGLGTAAKSLSRLVKGDLVMTKVEFKDYMQDKMFTTDIEDKVWNDNGLKKDLMLGGIWWAVCKTFFMNPFQVYGEIGAAAVTAWQAFFYQGELDLGRCSTTVRWLRCEQMKMKLDASESLLLMSAKSDGKA